MVPPVLLKVTLPGIKVVPVLADLRNVPALLNTAVPLIGWMEASFWMWKRPPIWLFRTAVLPVLLTTMSPVPVQTTVPALLRVRWERVLLADPLMFSVLPAEMVVAPVPLIVPPVQFMVPVTVR